MSMSKPDTQRHRGAPNPFYVALILASTLFVATCLGYLISPTVLEQARGRKGAAGMPSVRFAQWLDRKAPTLLGVEFLVMLAAGGLAMATEQSRARKPSKGVGSPEGRAN